MFHYDLELSLTDIKVLLNVTESQRRFDKTRESCLGDILTNESSERGDWHGENVITFKFTFYSSLPSLVFIRFAITLRARCRSARPTVRFIIDGIVL